MDHERWVKEEGGIEHPTSGETLKQPCQQKRIEWLMRNADGCILEIGCNWGYVLNKVARYNNSEEDSWGMDINLENITKAIKAFPNLTFSQEDATQGLFFGSHTFDTVMLPDMLEHIDYDKVDKVLREAARVTENRILITLPQESRKRHCFKHCWLVTRDHIDQIANILKEYFAIVTRESDGDFYYIKGVGRYEDD